MVSHENTSKAKMLFILFLDYRRCNTQAGYGLEKTFVNSPSRGCRHAHIITMQDASKMAAGKNIADLVPSGEKMTNMSITKCELLFH